MKRRDTFDRVHKSINSKQKLKLKNHIHFTSLAHSPLQLSERIQNKNSNLRIAFTLLLLLTLPYSSLRAEKLPVSWSARSSNQQVRNVETTRPTADLEQPCFRLKRLLWPSFLANLTKQKFPKKNKRLRNLRPLNFVVLYANINLLTSCDKPQGTYYIFFINVKFFEFLLANFLGCRAVASKGSCWLLGPYFRQTVNLISTRGADYAQHITTSTPLDLTLRPLTELCFKPTSIVF